MMIMFVKVINDSSVKISCILELIDLVSCWSEGGAQHI